MRANRTHGRTPRSFVEVGPETTVKRFVTKEGAAHELSFYQLVPWACPELLDHDEYTLTMRSYECAFSLPDWRPVNELRALLQRLHREGVHHRDLHVKNVLRGPGGLPVLIDWECAIVMRTQLSYDLSGPGISKVPIPDLHVRLNVTPAWWHSRERHSISNQWGR